MSVPITTVLTWLCVVFFTFSLPCYATEKAQPAKAHVDSAARAKLLQEAQSFFKIGYVFQQQGLEDMALQAFKKSRALLLQASGEKAEPLQKQLTKVTKSLEKKSSSVASRPKKSFKTLGGVKVTRPAPLMPENYVRSHALRLLTENRKFLENSFRKSHSYMPMIREEFLRQGIPLELAYLAIIESGFNTDVLSHAGARGMWQFMPETARYYGLEVSAQRDERLDPIKSTKAASVYLKKLYNQFKNWPLALAAYNCGENRVDKALKKHNAKSFWELVQYNALPKETQKYVPSVMAVALISQNLNLYGLKVHE